MRREEEPERNCTTGSGENASTTVNCGAEGKQEGKAEEEERNENRCGWAGCGVPNADYQLRLLWYENCVAVLIITLSVLFEAFKDKLLSRLPPEYAGVVHHGLAELASLGFVALCFFVVNIIDNHVVGNGAIWAQLAAFIFAGTAWAEQKSEGPKHAQEGLEGIHFMIFCACRALTAHDN